MEQWITPKPTFQDIIIIFQRAMCWCLTHFANPDHSYLPEDDCGIRDNYYAIKEIVCQLFASRCQTQWHSLINLILISDQCAGSPSKNYMDSMLVSDIIMCKMISTYQLLLMLGFCSWQGGLCFCNYKLSSSVPCCWKEKKRKNKNEGQGIPSTPTFDLRYRQIA